MQRRRWPARRCHMVRHMWISDLMRYDDMGYNMKGYNDMGYDMIEWDMMGRNGI